MSGAVTVRVLADLDEIKSHRDRLIALRDASGSRNPFAGPEWTLNWYDSFCADAGRQPWLVEVYRGEELIGAAPLWQQHPLGGRLHRGGVLRPVGRGRPWIGPFEIAGALALPERGREVGRAVVAHLCEVEADWTWAHLAFGDIAPWLEPDWLSSDRFLLMQRGAVSTVVLELEPGGPRFQPRRNLRESLRRARNRLQRHAGDDWQVRRAQDPVEVSAAFGRLCELHRQRSVRTDKQAQHEDVLADRGVRDFVARTVGDLAACGLASVYELVVGDTVLAAQLVLATARSTHLSLSGQREEAWDFSAITYLQWCAVEAAQDAGHELVDFSAGPIQSKLRWSQTVRSYPEFAVVAPRRAAQLAYWAEVPRGAAARIREARNADRRTPR